MSSQRRQQGGLGRWALLLALLALALRVLYLLESGENPFREHLALDPLVYDQWARSILSGRVLGPDAFPQAPLFPYFVSLCYALFGAAPTAVLWIQTLLGSATVFLGAQVAGRLWGRPALLATGLLLALYKPAIFYTGALLAPTLATLLLALALWLAVRRGSLRGLGAGLAAGLAGLAHPLVLPGTVVALWGLVRGGTPDGRPVGSAEATGGQAATRAPQRPARSSREADGTRRNRARPRLLLLLGILLAILPATVHNLAMSGAFVPISANAGVNLQIGNGPQATGFYAASRRDPNRAQDLTGLAEAERVTGRELTPAEASRYWTRQALDAVREDPGRALGLFLRKLYYYLHAYEAPQIESLDFEKRFSCLLRIPILPNWMLLLALAAGALVLGWDDRRIRLLGLAVLATALATALFFVTGRFRFPMHLLLALMAGAGIARAMALRRSAGTALRRWVAAVVVVLLTYALLYPNHLAIARDQTLGQYHHRLGVMAEREGHDARARAAYAEALRLDPR
ncbi:MAG: hypothetical protein GF330_05955, partial [Candidatus Eisenbacteria bacterium]|nr:hypothetical protein [Candidatus Eisenbacteria bacterium]